MKIVDWEEILDETPDDWLCRAAYADWLEEYAEDADALIKTQRWMVENKKCPGPACVLEAKWHEASWFRADQCGVHWLMHGQRSEYVLDRWCLSTDLFNKLSGYFWQNRLSHFGLQFARSWNGRIDAEVALSRALFPKIAWVTMGASVGHTAGLIRINFD